MALLLSAVDLICGLNDSVADIQEVRVTSRRFQSFVEVEHRALIAFAAGGVREFPEPVLVDQLPVHPPQRLRHHGSDCMLRHLPCPENVQRFVAGIIDAGAAAVAVPDPSQTHVLRMLPRQIRGNAPMFLVTTVRVGVHQTHKVTEPFRRCLVIVLSIHTQVLRSADQSRRDSMGILVNDRSCVQGRIPFFTLVQVRITGTARTVRVPRAGAIAEGVIYEHQLEGRRCVVRRKQKRGRDGITSLCHDDHGIVIFHVSRHVVETVSLLDIVNQVHPIEGVGVGRIGVRRRVGILEVDREIAIESELPGTAALGLNGRGCLIQVRVVEYMSVGTQQSLAELPAAGLRVLA